MSQLTQTTAQVQSIINTAISNPMTTSGDLIVGVTGSAPTRLAKGTAKQVLAVNSSANGLEWKSIGGGSGSGTTFVDLEVSGDPFDSYSGSPSWSFSSQAVYTTAQAMMNAIISGDEYVVLRFTDSSGSTSMVPVSTCRSYAHWSGQGTAYELMASLYPSRGGMFMMSITDDPQSGSTSIYSSYNQ